MNIEGLTVSSPCLPPSLRDVTIRKNWSFPGPLCARHCVPGWLLLKGIRKGIYSFSNWSLTSFIIMAISVYGSVDDWVEKLEPHCLVTYLADNRFRIRTQVIYFPVQCESETQRNWDLFCYYFTKETLSQHEKLFFYLNFLRNFHKFIKEFA